MCTLQFAEPRSRQDASPRATNTQSGTERGRAPTFSTDADRQRRAEANRLAKWLEHNRVGALTTKQLQVTPPHVFPRTTLSTYFTLVSPVPIPHVFMVVLCSRSSISYTSLTLLLQLEPQASVRIACNHHICRAQVAGTDMTVV
jgi:hypothetical protein